MKTNIIKSVIALLSLAFLMSGCTKDMTKSLSEILTRNEVDGNGNAGGGGAGARPGGGAPSAYKGNGAAMVNQLLSKVSGWRTASCANCNDGIPPSVRVSGLCQRDAYVSAAVGYAWAAESYYRLGDMAKASSAVNLMLQNLQLAKNLCGPSTINAGGSCITTYIFPC